MAGGAAPEWTPIYETRSQLDADLVCTTLEVAGYRVLVSGGSTTAVLMHGLPNAITVAVPAVDADDARDFLREKTGLLSNEPTPDAEAVKDLAAETIADAATEVLDLRRQHESAACKYCGIPTLELSEAELTSHQVALLRAAGLGVNSATFSEFQPCERICTECAGHEVTCDLCARVVDAFLDQGEYRQVTDDEAYVCTSCTGKLEDQLQTDRDW